VRTIAVINQKGGVGKTTTTANLGAAIAARGHDVCLIDIDPQAHLTLHLGVEPGKNALSMYNVLADGADLATAVVPVGEHLWLAPSVIDLAAAEVELVTTVGREQILRDQLAAQADKYELAMIDCPPSLGLLTLNALAAADDVVIPLQPHFLALQGLGKLLETISLVQRRINPRLKVAGVVLCMWETNTRLSAEVLADLQGFFGGNHAQTPWSGARVYQSAIRRNVKLAECPSYGRTIFAYEPQSRGAEDYAALAEEFMASLGLATTTPAAAATGAETPQPAPQPPQPPAAPPPTQPPGAI
jgi:chromosome partitioning protein